MISTQTLSAFDHFIRTQSDADRLVIQPRMGFASVKQMRQSLEAVKASCVSSVGTITLDSYTRMSGLQRAARSLIIGDTLNGFPLPTHGLADTGSMLEKPLDSTFPAQVRHGTAEPQAIFRRMTVLGLNVAEGDPVSYCLPYSRLPLSCAIASWSDACLILSEELEQPHLESFGGCLLGQLCPPSMLITHSLLECLFFVQHGIRSVAMSYAQGASDAQDRAAVQVLRNLSIIHFPDTPWHCVLYTYMGVFSKNRSWLSIADP